MKEMMEITKEEYEALLEDQKQLRHLECNGVDNWEGFSHYSWDEEE
jgi:hypothetical protein